MALLCLPLAALRRAALVAAGAFVLGAPAAALAQTPSSSPPLPPLPPPATAPERAMRAPGPPARPTGDATPPEGDAPAGEPGRPAQSGESGASGARRVVEVRGERGVLEGRVNPEGDATFEAGDKRGWERVCVLPCARPLDPALEYRIAGRGVQRSRPFRVPAAEAEMLLDVDAGSRAQRVTGIVFIPVGGTTLLGGLLAGALAGAFDNQEAQLTSFVVAGAGALLMTTGIVMVSSNRTTVRALVRGGPAVELASGLTLTPRGLTF